MRHRLSALVLVACAATAAFADTRTAVVVGASASDPSALQISDELRAMGLEVEVVPHDSDRARIRKRARSEEADAVVLVSEREIEVLVVVEGKVQVQYISRRSDTDTSTSALAAVEVVRGLLVPVDPPPVDVIAPVVPPVGSHAENRDAYARFGLGVSLSELPTQEVVTFGAGWFWSRAGLELATTIALPGTNLQSGSPFWTGTLGVAFQYAILERRRRISVLAFGGVAGLMMYVRDDNKKWNGEAAAVPYLGVGTRVRVVGIMSARLDGTLGVPFPVPEIRLRAGEIASFGHSATQLTAGVELAW